MLKEWAGCLMIFWVSEMDLTAVICLFWVPSSICISCRFWLTCHISNKAWTLAILCNILCSTTLIISELFSVFIVSNAGSLPASIRISTWANCHTMSVLQMLLPVVSDSLHLITSPPRKILASTTTSCDMTENMLHAAMLWSAYFVSFLFRWHQQSVISGIQIVMLSSIALEWQYLGFALSRPHVFSDWGSHFK